ncbi:MULTISPECIES: exodeoxyribonuclease V subunit gamma [unclassified Nocardioides]|uniref:exodeoxyribonuclease V subunit gamma n=1 Tax=unclassified Nocardioides TaxID=2615069 RepID=UPI0006FDC7B2|nr:MULTISPECIES: exodeoxyribonuclease V subunit gamma [unclassified Nocardioides]KRA38861.1 exodeoxyribonuclease V subunit gamma [Nocardioides sp. Root614]KRA92821.1 exodeoxyribonuclease V subunit gamma [Nocardioides sp. Root682]
MALHLHRAARTDLLADELGALLATPLADPFASEVVVVPAKGVERWLTQRLSHHLGVGPCGGDGVCAGVQFLQPASLVGLLLGRDRDDPWHPDRLVWPLLATIDAHLGEPWCATLATHLGHGLAGEEGELRRSRRWSVARRLAERFSSYAVQRPALVTDWREGRDTDGIGGDGAGELVGDLRWEAELWRRLLARMAEAGHTEPPDVRHARVCTALRAGEMAGLDLPDRLSLFGHTRLPETEIDLLAALGQHRDVHLWLAQPSAALWDAVASAEAAVTPRDASRSADLVGHPLLASLGRDARELATVLGARVREGDAIDAGAAPDPEAPENLLGWLQADLRANHAPEAGARAARAFDPRDRTVQVHACHGAARQIDVLREVLVGLLEDDPTLEPRDIVVMCPDIETFAPLISAGFGLGELITDESAKGVADVLHPAHRLRVRLADRAASSTNPLLGVAVALVELAGGRATASQVIDLLSREVCRRRFGFSDDDLARITRWVAEAGIRWGIDGTQRTSYAMEGFEHNTWRAGLDRLLLGVAMSDDEHQHLGRGLPVDDVASGEIELVGRLSEAVARLGACLAALSTATAADDWFDAITGGVRDLCEVDPDAAWQLPQFERELARARASADETGPDVPLRLADVRALLQARLAGRPTRANFRTGTLTVCTMVPMRSVPHRVVCLVGLDDGVFPRATGIDGDDVLARRPVVGERDLRAEDRQLLLDAVLAAGERLVITYTGAAEHTGQERPPAVPLGELLDALDRTAAAPVRADVVVRHPLQPYDVRNHVPGSLATDGPFSFDRSSLAGALASVAERVPVPAFLPDALPAQPPADVSLADLRAFLHHPARYFLRRRLEVATPFEPDQVADAIPVTLNGLEVWQIGDRLLREVLAAEDPGATATAVMVAEQLRGTLPPFELGRGELTKVVAECQELFTRSAPVRTGAARSIDVDIDLGGGRRLTGTVPQVHGNQVVSLSYSRLKPKQRLSSWLDVLALSASHPDENWTAHAIARSKAGPQRALVGPLDHRALEWLTSIVELHDQGLTRPLPLPLATANAWAEAQAKSLRGMDIDPVEAAARSWVTDPWNDWGIKGEDDDPSHRRIYGPDAPIDVLVDAGLTTWAWQLWEPLLAGAERVGVL